MSGLRRSIRKNLTLTIVEPGVLVPTNAIPPELTTDAATVGQTYAISTGLWSNGPILSHAFKLQSSADGSEPWADIPGATSETGTFGSGLDGKHIRAAVKATNAAGESLTWSYSDAIGPIAAALTISGTPPTTATVGVEWTFTPSSTGGRAPKVYSFTNLPAGGSFDPATGEASFLPDSAGTLTDLNVGVTDADGLTANIGAWDVVVASAVSKWRNFSFLATSAGDATWAGALVPPNDDDNVTTATIAPAPGYPVASADGLNSYGFFGATPAINNVTKTNSGSNPLLAGSLTLSSSGQGVQFDGQAGNYDVRLAMNSHTGGSQSTCLLFDGTLAHLFGDLGANASTIWPWAASTAFGVNVLLVSSIDLGIWKLTSPAGTSGTTEPSGPGPTFTDGALTWTRQSRTALAMITGTSAGSSSVVDTTGQSVLCTAWGANSLPITISGAFGNGITLMNIRTKALYLRHFSMKLTASPLANVKLYNEFGAETLSPTIYANQPEGYAAFRLSTSAGAASVANFSFAGDLAPYFTPKLIKSSVWAVCNATRLPDSFAEGDPPTLNVIQTDGASPGSPHTTSYACNVVSSQGRPTDTSVLGQITTQTHLSRKVVKDVIDNIWPGYEGQAFASDQLVTGGDDLVAKLVGLNPDGASWYRLRLGAGTYEGLKTTDIWKDFGAGGLLIERDASADPEINVGLYSLQMHGLVWRDTTFTNDASKTGAYQQLNLVDPGPGGILGGGRFNKVKVHHSRIGFMFASGATVTEWRAKASSFLALSHGESAEISDCQFKGSGATFLPNGVRVLKYVDNDNQLSMDDMIGMTHARSVTSTQDVFEDNDIYLEMSRITTWNEPDYEGYDNGNHNDHGQTYKGMGSPALWERSMAWSKVGNNTLNMLSVPPRLYKVVTAGTTAASGNGPSGTGTGITDGTVVWDYVGDALFGDFHVLLEDSTLSSQGPIAGKNARQFFLDSNGGRGCAMNLTAINNLTASGSIFGISIGEGTLNVEFNTLASAANLKDTDTIQAAVFKSTLGGTVRALHNVVRGVSFSALGSAIVADEVILNWSAAAVSPNRPGDHLVGPFVQDGSGRWTYPSLIDDGSISAATFATGMRSILSVQSGSAGAKV